MVSFAQIPAALRTPGVFSEVDNSAAGGGVLQQKTLLLGQKTPAGSATKDVLQHLTAIGQETALFGQGSVLARLAKFCRDNDPYCDLYAIPLDDEGAAVRATGTVTFTAAATADGTLSFYVAGQRVLVAVVALDAVATLADKLRDALNGDAAELASGKLTVGQLYEITARNTYDFIADGAVDNDVGTVFYAAGNAGTLDATNKVKPINTDLPVAGLWKAGAAVTIWAKNKGSLANAIDLRINYLGALGGEQTPAGVALTIVAMAAGATDPVLTNAITAMGDLLFDFVGCPQTDTTSLNALKAEELDRWLPLKGVYGHLFSAKRDTAGGLTTFGNQRNDQHASVVGYESVSPTPPWEMLGAVIGQAAQSLRNDPARPLQTLALTGVLAPAESDRFTGTERNTLLFDGVATVFYSADGTARIERCITTYQLDSYGNADDSYLDVQTLFTLMYIIRDAKAAIESKYGRHKLVDDGTVYAPGQAVVTPSVIKGELVALYRGWMALALVENIEAFKTNLIVERNALDPNRLDALVPPDLANQFNILACNWQFRLQYEAAA